MKSTIFSPFVQDSEAENFGQRSFLTTPTRLQQMFSASSAAANTDENADFIGFPSMNEETIGRESQEAVGATFPVWNPNLAPLHIGQSTEGSNEIVSENHSGVGQSHQIDHPTDPTTEELFSDVVAPQSLIVPATENENQTLDIEVFLMQDLLPLHAGDLNERSSEIFGGVSEHHFMEVAAMSHVCNPCSHWQPLNICDANVRSSEIFGGASEEHFMEVGATSHVCNPYSDWLPLHIGELDERSSEIVLGVSENQFRVDQSQQIDHQSGVTTDEPSADAVAPPNSTVLAIENGQNASIFRPLPSLDSQTMACPLAFQGVGYSPSASYYPLDRRFHQNNIVHARTLDGSSTSNTGLEDYFMEQLTTVLKNREMSYENNNFRNGEVNPRKKKGKVNDGRRRCSCKKSRCLMLYCECFSSESQCDETCACKGCINRIEYRTLVLKKFTEIKSRNPFAFGPKIVPLHKENSLRGGIWLSSRNARHKRGCSCRKSKCLKNYCECYQASVKCSVGCRCKGCGNVYTEKNDAGPADFMIREAMNNSVSTYGFHSNGGEMLPQAESSNNHFGPLTLMSFENGRRLGLGSDHSISMSFGNSMDDNTVFQGRRAEDGNLALFSPPLNPYFMAMGSSISSLLPLQQWPPRESTSYGNSLSSDQTFGPRLLPPMNCYEVSADHNGTPLILNDSRFPALSIGANSPYRKRVSPPRFPVPETGSGMSTPSLPVFIPSNDADGRSNGQGDGEENGKV